MFFKRYSALLMATGIGFGAVAQNNLDEARSKFQLNTITTAVPFLVIAPETRGGGMGDVGVATSPDAASQHWNPAKYAFVEDKFGFSTSYTPWLKELVPDIFVLYLTGYYKLNKVSTLGASIRYFSLGNIQFTNAQGQPTTQFTPSELALDVSYNRKLAKRLSAGLGGKFVNSNLTGGQMAGTASTGAGRTAAVDLGVYYQNDDVNVFGKETTVAAGLSITNLGAKISYTNTTDRDYLPINLRLGPRVTWNLDDYNKISLAVDLNKYLVPTPPIYLQSANGSDSLDSEGNAIIFSGMDPDRPVPVGVISSFYDAPGTPTTDASGNVSVVKGSRFGEEMREISYGIGTEYWYSGQFGARMGFYGEHATKGSRKFLTFGIGLKMNVFALDFSYLIPVYTSSSFTAVSPLSRTMRFTLSFNFADVVKGETDGPPTE